MVNRDKSIYYQMKDYDDDYGGDRFLAVGRCVRREKITNCLDTRTTQQPIRRLTNHIFRQIPIKIQMLGGDGWRYLKSPPIKEKVNYSG